MEQMYCGDQTPATPCQEPEDFRTRSGGGLSWGEAVAGLLIQVFGDRFPAQLIDTLIIAVTWLFCRRAWAGWQLQVVPQAARNAIYSTGRKNLGMTLTA